MQGWTAKAGRLQHAGLRSNPPTGSLAPDVRWKPVTPDTPVLFLGIDGVLHPAGHSSFCHMRHLLEIVERVPTVRIVISCTWRHGAAAGYMHGLFPTAVWERIVATTPKLPRRDRAAECLRYARLNNLRRFIAIDSRPDLFASAPELLVAVDPAVFSPHELMPAPLNA